MNRNYQQEHDAYGSFDQAYQDESEESRQRKEYRDLYDPFKSNWNSALGSLGRRVSEQAIRNVGRGYTVTQGKENFSASTYGNREHGNQRYGYSPYESQGEWHQVGRGNPPVVNRDSEQNTSSFDPFGTKQEQVSKNAELEGGSAFSSAKSGSEAIKNTYRHYTTGYGPRD